MARNKGPFGVGVRTEEKLRVIESFLDDDSSEELQNIIFDCLLPFDALLVCQIFGLGQPALSLRRIAKITGMKRHVVAKKRDAAIEKLREHPVAGRIFREHYIH